MNGEGIYVVAALVLVPVLLEVYPGLGGWLLLLLVLGLLVRSARENLL